MKLRMIRKSGGVALVTAIFLLVVLAGLAVAVVSLTTSQQTSATQDEQGARAYQAARAGIEWALFISLQTGGGLVNNPLGCPRTAANAYSFGLPAPSLSAFTVTVTCSQQATGYGNAAGQPDSTAGGITITATACNQPGANGCPNSSPGPDYVQRVIRAQL
jgi:MSHA biogenesis protein MshP